MTEPPPSLWRRVHAVALGLFALWQMVFLVAANVIDLIPRNITDPPSLRLDPLQEHGQFTSLAPLQALVDGLGEVIDAYSELTGQEQTWPLFAPGFPPHSTFGAIRLTLADGSQVTLRSDFEPPDPNHAPFRLPFFQVRRFNLEHQFLPVILQHTQEAMREYAEVVRTVTFQAYRYNQPLLQRWMRWCVDRWQRAHPGQGPVVEIVYLARYIPSPRPGEPKVWSGAVRERPLARWLSPHEPTPAGELPLQVYDAGENRWVTLLRDGGER